MKNAYSLLAAALTGAGLLVACGGGGDTPSASTSVSGVAMDGYLKNARACLDKNGNGGCDSGEPFAMTTDGGKFKIEATAEEVAQYPVVVEAIAGQTIDEDTGTAVATSYKLTAPAGKAAVVSPLTTLVMARMAAGSSRSEAEDWARTQLGLSGDLYKDYVAGNDSAMHALAQNVVMVLEGAASSEAVLTGFAARVDEIKTGQKSVSIDFASVLGDTPVDCSTASLSNLGTTAASGTLKDMRFYISNVKLVKADGSETALTLPANDDWNATLGSDGVTLIDLEDKTGTCGGTTATNKTLKGTVPAGNYVGVKMTLGVPFSLNHTNQAAGTDVTPAAVNNAVNPSMAWSWAGGRKFAKIEVTNATWSAPTFNVHLGSTGCKGALPANGQVDSCDSPNRVPVDFAAFDPSTQKVAVDVKSLLQGVDVTKNSAGTSAGCMSFVGDAECPGVFDRLGLDYTTGAVTTTPQALFKVVSK